MGLKLCNRHCHVEGNNKKYTQDFSDSWLLVSQPGEYKLVTIVAEPDSKSEKVSARDTFSLENGPRGDSSTFSFISK